MGTKERKERERDEMRELILNAANDIISKDGIDSLSVRKIANRIEYSPSIIYHYFRDKDDIVNSLLKRSYQKIMGVLASAQASSDDPSQIIREMSRNYINLALQIPDEYLKIMLSSPPAILEHTSVLTKDISLKRPSMQMLCKSLKELYSDMSDTWIELTAQVMWTAAFGLIIRLIIEKNMISEEQKQDLIEHHIKTIVDGVVLKNTRLQ